MTLYSHSRLSTFEQCPLRFKFSYIDKLEPEIEETVEAFLGKRVHEALEKLYKDIKFQKIPELQELLDFYNKEWEKNWNENILIVRKEYNEENFRKMGEKFITDYYNKYKPFDKRKTIGLETQNTIKLDENHSIHIRIDRLTLSDDDVYEIHDYKTSNSLPTQEYLDNDRQLAIYAYGVKKMYPDAKKVRLVWHFLAFNKEMTSERTDEQLGELKDEILKLIKKIEKCKEFPAKESALCNWCQFQPDCPNFKHKFSLEKKSANEYLKDNGVTLVNKYSKTNHEIKEKEIELEKIKEALVEYADKQGIEVVFGSDIKAAVKKYPKLSFPKKDDPRRPEFFETVRNIGLWNQLAIVDVFELTKMLNRGEINEELVNLLNQFIERSENIRVYLRKK